MNLYEFSQQNNDEMGLLVSREEDGELYERYIEESMRIVRMSKDVRVTVAEVETEREGRQDRKTRRTAGRRRTGFCIRCRNSILANAAQPYCGRCFKSLESVQERDFEEKHCHTCGKEHKATMSEARVSDLLQEAQEVGRLDDKIAVVTGGGTGIGKGIARAFAAEGADLAIASRNRARLEETAVELRALGADVLVVTADVATSGRSPRCSRRSWTASASSTSW